MSLMSVQRRRRRDILLVGLFFLFLVACTGEKEQADELSKEAEMTSELNSALAYNDVFAKRFGLPEGEAVELETGVLAIRMYWTTIKTPMRPEGEDLALLAQFYFDQDVPLPLDNEEGTLSNYETFVRSGFRYFKHEPPRKGENIWERDHEEFRNRVIAVDEGIATISLDITRYKRELIPGVQAVEVSMLLPDPTHVFFYVGDEPPTIYTLVPAFHRVSRDVDDYEPGQFMRVELPDELQAVLRNPYVGTPDQ